MAVLLMIGCTAIKYVPIKGEDVIRTEYVELIKDSIVYVEIENEVYSNSLDTSRDTLSVLDNSYSISRAEYKRGHLNHTLKTKHYDSIPVKIKYKDKLIVRDSIIRNVVIEEVEKPIRDDIFWYSIIFNVIFVMLILWRLKKLFNL